MHHFVLDAGQGAQLSLYHHAVSVCIFNHLLGQGDVVLEALGGSIDHDGSETAVDTILAQLKGVAVIQMKGDGDVGMLDHGSLYQLHQIGVV